MPWHLKTEGDQVLVVRDRDQKVVGRHANRKKATAQLRVLYSLEKAQFQALIEKGRFASRSEAGRYAANQRWQGHVKDANTSAQARDLTQKLKDYFGKNKAEYEISEGRQDIEHKKAVDRKNGRSPNNDTQLEIIADMQGFTSLPKVVSSSEIDELEKQGWTIAYRGVNGGAGENEKGNEVLYSGTEIAEQFRTGGYFAGEGIYGNGIYFATDRKTAEEYATYEDPEVIRVAIPPNALMNRKDFETEVTTHRERFRAGNRFGNFEESGFYGIGDIGRALTAKGVRGVQTNTLISGGFSMDVGSTGHEPNVILIFDRSMLAVEESQKSR